MTQVPVRPSAPRPAKRPQARLDLNPGKGYSARVRQDTARRKQHGQHLKRTRGCPDKRAGPLEDHLIETEVFSLHRHQSAHQTKNLSMDLKAFHFRKVSWWVRVARCGRQGIGGGFRGVRDDLP